MILIIVCPRREDKASACCSSAPLADMLPFLLGGARVFLILLMIQRLLSHGHVQSQSPPPPSQWTINDSTVVDTETSMTLTLILPSG